MVTITIRGVPGDIHSVLIDRAAQQGISLQTYVLRELIEMAERPDLETWLTAVNKSIEQEDYPDGLSPTECVKISFDGLKKILADMGK